MVNTLSEGIAADHDDPTLVGYTHPLDPGVVARASSGDDIPTSVANAESRADFEGEFGWRASLEKEIRRVESFGAWSMASGRDLAEARKAHIVIAFRVKSDADGELKGGGVIKK